MQTPTAGGPVPPRPSAPVLRDPIRDAAVALEARFLGEMLTAAGIGRAPGAFGGGAGEEQFASFLVEAEARRIAETGGIGLAGSLMLSLGRHRG